MDCLFCKIAAGEIPATIIYEDDQVVAFEDIDPQAPQHQLIIPRKHIETLNALNENDTTLMGHVIFTAKKLAEKANNSEKGYRVVMNCNPDAGQTVFHIHAHVLGGRKLTWPPG